MNNYNIATIIVTYNRCDLLKNCLNSIEQQTNRPKTIFIVNNASTDCTESYLNNYRINGALPVHIINLKKNIGGAGGFCIGLKTAYESNLYDAFWLMDDDGKPDKHCLEKLSEQLVNYSYIAPLVISMENHNEVAFDYLKEKNINDILLKYGTSGIINNYANPFNGILLKKDLVCKIGYPKPDMFIWGDEVEYSTRAVYYGFPPVTIISAIHFHPKDRMIRKKDFLGRKAIIDVDSKLRAYCKFRNSAYTFVKYRNYSKLIYYFFSNIFYLIFQRKFNKSKISLFLEGFTDGIHADFSKNEKYK